MLLECGFKLGLFGGFFSFLATESQQHRGGAPPKQLNFGMVEIQLRFESGQSYGSRDCRRIKLVFDDGVAED